MTCTCPDKDPRYEYSQWIGSLFGACAYSPTQKSAYVLGAISLAVWFVALLPQIVSIHRRKSGKGVSLGFLGLSTVGGICLLIGGLLTNSPLPVSILGLYVVLCNVIVAVQVLYYGRGRRPSKVTLARFSAAVIAVAAPVTFLSLSAVQTTASPGKSRVLLDASFIDPNRCNYRPETSAAAKTIGSVLAWMAGVIFFCSRAPQIYQNYCTKQVRISLWMVALMMLGNIALGLQVLLLCDELSSFWSKTLPMVLASIGIVIWDVVIFLQAFLYRKRPRYF